MHELPYLVSIDRRNWRRPYCENCFKHHMVIVDRKMQLNTLLASGGRIACRNRYDGFWGLEVSNRNIGADHDPKQTQ